MADSAGGIPVPATSAAAGRIRPVRIGIDTGGTFTDVVAVDEQTGELVTTKTPSTPEDPADGFMTGLTKALELLGRDGTAVGSVAHGTTVATNQLLEGKLGSLGFITNEGYEFLLEIARQSVPDGYGNSYFWVKPDRIVPVDRVRTVRGRLDFRGGEVRPFDREQAVEVARWFRRQEITTIGVCFLHSYADLSHEQAMREILAVEHPDAVVSLSCDVLREYREYERAVTTLVDAAVKPKVAAYVANLARRLHDLAPGVPFSIMRSNGGVLSAEEVVHQPISTVLSGPAAGALGAGLIAQRAGFQQVLTLDGGGTSTDVSVVLDGEPTLTTEGSIGRYPCKIPMIDVVTVGAGGGSVAWISPEGTLKVGPRSAGAVPGPMCYPDGGSEPTVTDAHVVLGRIPPHLLGGEVPLSVDAARDGMTKLAAELGMAVEPCAGGVLEISAWNQANALRQITVKRGLDVRDFTMVTFGGSGSLLACRLIDILGLPAVLVPRDPGNTSAYGLLTVDARCDYVQTAISRHRDLPLPAVVSTYAELRDRAAAALTREGFASDGQRFLRTADLRYFGQAFEVRVPVADGAIDLAAADDVATTFHAAHRALYGYDFAGDSRQQVEWVNLRVTGIGPIRRPEPREIAAGDGSAARALTGERPVSFETAYAPARIYDRSLLRAGDVLAGPAVIEEFGSTIPVHAGFTAEVDRFGNVVLAKTPPLPPWREDAPRKSGRVASAGRQR